jgi:hypothetical protein
VRKEILMRCGVVSILLATALSAPVSAHHSAARFILAQSVSVDGLVTRYEWANPHVYIYVTETRADGTTTEWEIEAQPPAMMRRVGWSRETLAVGDTVRVTGAPARDPSSKSLLLAALHKADTALFDAQKLRAAMSGNDGPSGEGAHRPSANGLDGVWLTLSNFETVASFARPAARFELTDAGATALAAFDEATMSPAIDCVPMPAPTATIVPDVKRITIRDDAILIAGEFDAGERIIHLADTGAARASTPPPSLQGHSIGRWEGKTLIVETTAFAPHALGLGLGLASSPQKRLVERLTLDADGTGLAYEFELTDEAMLAAPVTGKLSWVYRPDLEFRPEPCDLDNARRFLN